MFFNLFSEISKEEVTRLMWIFADDDVLCVGRRYCSYRDGTNMRIQSLTVLTGMLCSHEREAQSHSPTERYQDDSKY
jgi:hypothetical protein